MARTTVERWLRSLQPPQDESTMKTLLDLAPIAMDDIQDRCLNNVGDSSVGDQSFREQVTNDHMEDDRSHFETLCRPQARFLPEKDAEVQGWNGFIHGLQDLNHAALKSASYYLRLTFGPGQQLIRHSFDHISIPPEAPLRLYDCAFCNLMWLRPVLRGQDVPKVTHPVHHTLYDANGSTLRSLVVFVATAGPLGREGLLGPVGIGVYFHENSALNISQSLSLTYRMRPVPSSPRSILPDLTAATEALKLVRTRIMPDRMRLMREMSEEYRWSDEEVQAVARFRLIIATSSVALVEGITCSHPRCKFGRSTRDGASGETNAFTRLMEQIESLSAVGIRVVWYLVDRKGCRRAKSLAKGAYARHRLMSEERKLQRVTEEGSEAEQTPTVQRSEAKSSTAIDHSNQSL